MEALKERKFIGNRIGERTFCPPLPFCNRTYELPSQWLESDGVGTVEAFTVVHQEPNQIDFQRSSDLPSPPYVLGVIRPNDSDQCFIHFLSGFDAENPDNIKARVKAGLAVRPVWTEERAGNIMDIKYFEPVG